MKKRDIYIAIGVVVVIIAGVLLTYKKTHDTTPQPSVSDTAPVDQKNSADSTDGKNKQNAATGDSKTDTETQGGKIAVLPRGNPPVRPQVKGAETIDFHDGMSFEEAMRAYGLFSYHFQFVSCHGQPGQFVLKQGTKFMLDNRDAIPHLIGVKNHNYSLAGYDFAIARAYDLGSYMITCDGGGAAAVNVVE